MKSDIINWLEKLIGGKEFNKTLQINNGVVTYTTTNLQQFGGTVKKRGIKAQIPKRFNEKVVVEVIKSITSKEGKEK